MESRRPTATVITTVKLGDFLSKKVNEKEEEEEEEEDEEEILIEHKLRVLSTAVGSKSAQQKDT